MKQVIGKLGVERFFDRDHQSHCVMRGKTGVEQIVGVADGRNVPLQSSCILQDLSDPQFHRHRPPPRLTKSSRTHASYNPSAIKYIAEGMAHAYVNASLRSSQSVSVRCFAVGWN